MSASVRIFATSKPITRFGRVESMDKYDRAFWEGREDEAARVRARREVKSKLPAFDPPLQAGAGKTGEATSSPTVCRGRLTLFGRGRA